MYNVNERSVTVGDKKIYLNKILIRQKGLTEKVVEDILRLHETRMQICYEMYGATDSTLPDMALQVWQIDVMLQEAWGFERNDKYIKFWDVPRCTCPKMDNDDRWPSGFYVVEGDCPIHTSELWKTVVESACQDR